MRAAFFTANKALAAYRERCPDQAHPQPSIFNLQPSSETRNPEPEARNPKPKTRNLKLDFEPRIRNPEPETQNLKPLEPFTRSRCTLDHRPVWSTDLNTRRFYCY